RSAPRSPTSRSPPAGSSVSATAAPSASPIAAAPHSPASSPRHSDGHRVCRPATSDRCVCACSYRDVLRRAVPGHNLASLRREGVPFAVHMARSDCYRRGMRVGCRSIVVLSVVACACVPSIPPLPRDGGPSWLELKTEHVTLWTDAPSRDGRELVREVERRRELI